jgi:hypothetical protein
MACEGGQCLKMAETWVSNLLKLNAEKGHEILPPNTSQSRKTSHLLFFHYPWNPGQAPRKTNKLNKMKYRNRMYQSPIF